VRSILESIRLDLDVISQVLPPLDAILVTDVIQRPCPELDVISVAGLIRAFVAEVKITQDIELVQKPFEIESYTYY
jgi:hypothetical protein